MSKKIYGIPVVTPICPDGTGGGTGTGKDGEDGGYYVPTVNDGVLNWTPSKAGMPAVPSANVKGDPGKTPVKGTDYFTTEEVQEIAEQAAGMVEVPEGGGITAEEVQAMIDAALGEIEATGIVGVRIEEV